MPPSSSFISSIPAAIAAFCSGAVAVAADGCLLRWTLFGNPTAKSMLDDPDALQASLPQGNRIERK
ncbi:hypothetical protein [Sphingomonas sp.]|uniref:hypothetical protein n=1 Tax=Sphingomonas sp. TaxID=28214 RepID=UPI003B3A542A